MTFIVTIGNVIRNFEMDKTIASNLNGFFCDSLTSGDCEAAMDFISDYFCCQDEDGK